MEEEARNQDQEKEREAALALREAELERRERAASAREALAEAGLPRTLAEHLDLSSDEALARGLRLVREARRTGRDHALGAPKAARAGLAAEAGYAQRALIYQTDRNSYLEQYKGE